MNDLTLVMELFAFLSMLGIQTPTELPKINIISTKEMIWMTDDKQGFHQENLGQIITGMCVNGTIYIDSKVDMSTVMGKSVLIHELTHYTQNKCAPVPKKDIMKIATLEAQAYAAQNRWIQANKMTIEVKNPYGVTIYLPAVYNWK